MIKTCPFDRKINRKKFGLHRHVIKATAYTEILYKIFIPIIELSKAFSQFVKRNVQKEASETAQSIRILDQP